jgi:hypothetical protein
MNPHDDELKPVAPTPQDWGFPVNATVRQREVWNRQEMFLEAFKECGKAYKAARAVGLTPWCVDKWLQADSYSIKKRMELAHKEYCENKIEQLMDDRLENPQGNRGSDILLMFKAKAEMPAKYREETKVIGVEAPLQMLEKLKELGRKELDQPLALEPRRLKGSTEKSAYLDRNRQSRPPTAEEVDISPPPEPPRWSAKDRRQQQVRAVRAARGRTARHVSQR